MTLKADALAPFQPLRVHEHGQLVGALISRRHALGWLGVDLDERAGFCERYSSKAEVFRRPAGRPAWRFDVPSEVNPAGQIRASGMSDLWLGALGLALVLVDEATAKAIGAVPAPMRPPPPKPGAGGHTQGAQAARRIKSGKRSTMSIEAFAASERTRTLALSLKATVTGYSWLQDRPELRERAERIERELIDLADHIGEAA